MFGPQVMEVKMMIVTVMVMLLACGQFQSTLQSTMEKMLITMNHVHQR